VVVTNGMMIPNYSKPDDWERFNALGVTQYGQMTAGSYMYIGPQGIVHGTTITVLNACRMIKGSPGTSGKLFVTSGLGGMSGAQPKAGNIAGVVTICAEVNATAAHKRHSQGWVDEVIAMWTSASMPPWPGSRRAKRTASPSSATSWTCGSAWPHATSRWTWAATRRACTTPGPVATTRGPELRGEQRADGADPAAFKQRVQDSLRTPGEGREQPTAQGMYFFDYGNAFLLESKRAGAEIGGRTGEEFRYPSYVEDIMGPDVLRPWLRSVPLGMHERRSEGPGHQRPHRR
jgi:urocanate hydratase